MHGRKRDCLKELKCSFQSTKCSNLKIIQLSDSILTKLTFNADGEKSRTALFECFSCQVNVLTFIY